MRASSVDVAREALETLRVEMRLRSGDLHQPFDRPPPFQSSHPRSAIQRFALRTLPGVRIIAKLQPLLEPAIYVLYPSIRSLPAKVRAMINFLADAFSGTPA